jgi:hypothetical protein
MIPNFDQNADDDEEEENDEASPTSTDSGVIP